MHGGLVVGGGILLGNVTGFFRIAVTAWLLGTHARADALAVAMGPLDTLNSVIVNTMLFAFVPMLLLVSGGARAALFVQARQIFLTMLAVASLLIALLAPELADLLGPGLAATERAQTIVLLRIMAPSTLLAGASAVYSAMLYTERRFMVPALYQTCLNGATIAGALALRQVIGVNGFAVGYALGSGLQLALTWHASRELRTTAADGIQLSTREILTKPGMFLVYAGLIAGNAIVSRAYATHAGAGMAASLDYCIRCVSVVNAYVVYPVATTLVPEIARLRAARLMIRARRLIDRSIGLMAAAAVAACGVGILLRTPVIALLFQRGSFTAESTHLVSAVFLGFAPSIVGWALLDLTARCFFALDRPRLPLVAAFVPISVNLMVSSFLRAQGKLANPALLGLGASAGLLAGFATLFVLIHVRGRQGVEVNPQLAEARQRA